MRRLSISAATVVAFLLAVPAAADPMPALPDGGSDPSSPPVPVSSPSTPGATDWRRVATSDEKIAVTVPCSASESTEPVYPATKMVSCSHGSLGYLVQMGDVPDKTGFKGYTDLLTAARKDPTAGVVEETTVAGHPAFTTTRPSGDALTRAEVIDLGPGRLVMLVAFQRDEQAKLAPSERAAADADAQRFIASLELTGK